MKKNDPKLHPTNTEITLLDDSLTSIDKKKSKINESECSKTNSLNLFLDDSSSYVNFKTKLNRVELKNVNEKNEQKPLLNSIDTMSIKNNHKISNENSNLNKISLESTETNNDNQSISNRSIETSLKKINFFADIRVFTFFMCLVVMLTNALTVGYRNSVITTIEKRFEFSSVYSGVLSGCLEVGSLITTLFVSYFCANSHIPKCIAISSLFCAFGSLLYSLPHLLSGSYTINNNVMNKTVNDLICKMSITSSTMSTKTNLILNLNSSSEAIRNSDSKPVIASFLNPFDLKSECLLKPSNIGHFVILIIANVLIGSSSAPLYTLGTTYIDNHVDKDNSSVYLAFIYSMLAFGPLIGYLVGAGFLQIYIDSFNFSIKELNIDTSDSNWVGAWFLGFILFGILIFFTSFPFFLFPKSIKKIVENESKINESSENSYENAFGNFKNLPKAIKNILINRVFMIVSLAFCFEITIISGFMTFLPKYLEHQFSVNNSVANIYTGGVAIPGAVIGIVLGGFLVKKFKIDPKGASIMAIACNIVCLCGIIVLITIGCPNIKMAGTTTDYFSYDNSVINNKKIEIGEFQLVSDCNNKCHCSLQSIEPVCGKNGITYFSPCYAGCTEYIHDKDKNLNLYSSCKCIKEALKNETNNKSSLDYHVAIPDAYSGSCTYDCQALIPFLIILFFITFLTALNQMPMLMVTLRSVDEIERPFALGLQLVIMRLLAYIPSPLIFGQAIDWTCIIWRKDECDKTGSCLFYNREKFRTIYGSIAAVYKAISLLLFIYLFVTVKRLNYKQKPIEITTIMKGSVNSINTCHNHNQKIKANSDDNLT